jgi:putative ABC transport system ATP-binding protein
MSAAAWIEIRGARKAYGSQLVLIDATARIARGETVAVVGRSGSGKSTLLRLIGGLESADAGVVLVDGRDLGALGESGRAAWRRRELGFVFQFFNLIPTLTVAENVELPLALGGRGPRECRTRAREVLAELGIETCAARFPEELSGGEQQRAAIARALVHEPKLVLADEPTGNLDAETAEQVLAVLLASCRKRAATLVMATHSAEIAAQSARMLSIRGGRVEE